MPTKNTRRRQATSASPTRKTPAKKSPPKKKTAKRKALPAKKPVAPKKAKGKKKPQPNGRPPKYDDPVKMARDADAYFEECKVRQVSIQVEGKDGGIISASVNRPAVPSKAGLRVFLDMSEPTVEEYAAGKYDDKCPPDGDKFSGVLARAHDRIQQAVVEYGFDGKNHGFAAYYLGAAFKFVPPAKLEVGGKDGGDITHKIRVVYDDVPPPPEEPDRHGPR